MARSTISSDGNTRDIRAPPNIYDKDTNKMAVDGPRPAESLRHLACSLAALNPAPWEKVKNTVCNLLITFVTEN